MIPYMDFLLLFLKIIFTKQLIKKIKKTLKNRLKFFGVPIDISSVSEKEHSNGQDE